MLDVSPEELISELDSGLENAGSPVTLRRLYGTNRIPVDVDCRMVIRNYASAEEMAGDIQQVYQKFIMSPTEINAAGWPGFHNNEPMDIDLRLPRKWDEILAPRGKLTVEEAEGFYVQGILVRIEGRVKGD